MITGCVAEQNGSDGIVLDGGGLVSHSLIASNAGDGIEAGGAATLVHNTLVGNGLLAIRGSQAHGIGGNTLSGNGTPGIPTGGVALHCNALDGIPSCPP